MSFIVLYIILYKQLLFTPSNYIQQILFFIAYYISNNMILWQLVCKKLSSYYLIYFHIFKIKSFLVSFYYKIKCKILKCIWFTEKMLTYKNFYNNKNLKYNTICFMHFLPNLKLITWRVKLFKTLKLIFA